MACTVLHPACTGPPAPRVSKRPLRRIRASAAGELIPGRGAMVGRAADPHAVGAAAHPAGSGSRGQGLLRQRGQPGLAAAAWDPAADRSAWGGVVGRLGRHRWKVERVRAVVAELLQAAAGALGPGLGAVFRLRAGRLHARLLQPARVVPWLIIGVPPGRRPRWTVHARAAATAMPGSAASSARPPPAARHQACPGRAGRAGGC
jgi:hypothetical protein